MFPFNFRIINSISILLILNEFISFNETKINYDSRKLYNIIYLSPSTKMSSFLIDFRDKFNMKEDKRKIKEKNFLKNDIIQVVQNSHNAIINLPKYLNSSIPAHNYYLKGISKDNKKLNEFEQYAYNISFSEKLISNFPKPIIRYPKTMANIKLDLEFRLDQPDIITQFKSEYFFNLNHIVSIKNLFFGNSKDNNLQLYRFFRLGIEELDVSRYFKPSIFNTEKIDLNNKKILKILIDSNAKKADRYLLLIDEFNSLYIFQITSKLIEKEGYYHEFKIILHLKDEKLEGKNVVDFVHKDGTFFLGIEKHGVILISNGKIVYEIKSFMNKKTNKEVLLDVKDIQEIEDCIYILVNNYGLKILNVKDLNNIKLEDFEFYHPYIEKIELHQNPNIRYYFLGILISNRLFTEGNEFFIEFDLEDEFLPQMSRIYLYDKIVSVTNILNDKFFTYIFEKNSNKFLIISRSYSANEFNSLFELHVEQLIGSNLVSLPFLFSDEFNFFNHVGVLGTNNFIYTKSIDFSSSAINFYFHEAGEYEIVLYSYVDDCGENVDINKMCKMELRYMFDVSFLPSSYKRIQNDYFYYIVVLFTLYNIICIFAYKNKYHTDKSFLEMNDENIEYNINGEKISSRSIDNKEKISEQIIEMS